jgi:hypothetical protein
MEFCRSPPVEEFANERRSALACCAAIPVEHIDGFALGFEPDFRHINPESKKCRPRREPGAANSAEGGDGKTGGSPCFDRIEGHHNVNPE